MVENYSELNSKFPQDKPKNMRQSFASNFFFKMIREITNKEVYQELSIPNKKHPDYPFRLDGYIEEDNLGIEFNGSKWHQDKDKERRKKEGVEALGMKYETVDFDIPKNLIYKNKNEVNLEKKGRYMKWLNKWCELKIFELFNK